MPRVLLPYREHERALPYEAVLRQVGLDVTLHPIESKAELTGFAGLVLMGGTDVAPSRYGEVAAPETETPDPIRDESESSLFLEALAINLPVLAICRGLQLVNVSLGGTLVQHLLSDRHRQREGDRSRPVHSVRITAGSRLASIAGTDLWQVNSRHHQAIRTPGRGLEVSGFDPEDATIEAIEMPDKRYVVGVQWHPEDQALSDPQQLKLFESFAAVLEQTTIGDR